MNHDDAFLAILGVIAQRYDKRASLSRVAYGKAHLFRANA